MKKIALAILLLALSELAVGCLITPVNAQEYPFPPVNAEEQWQPPYEPGTVIEPPAGVEVYAQTWPNLQIAQPSAVPHGTAATIINASIVNSRGQIITSLYRTGICYMIVSVNGPGYFYLWEYYPSGTARYGHWLCYRWYCPGAGIWKIGPYAAQSTDPAGMYTWKMWFLSGYTWSSRTLSFEYIRSYYPPDIPVIIPAQAASPAINSFSASKQTIESGETVILTWSTANANNVTISPGIGTVASTGSTSVTPASTTTYTLTAKGSSGGSISSTVTITINPRIPPGITIGQSKIQKGQTTSITWDAPGAIQVSVNGAGNVGSRGSMNVSPETTTTYKITATYIDGTTQSTSAAVTVEQPSYWIWGLIALLVIAAVVIAALLIRLLRRSARVQGVPETGVEAGYQTKAEVTQVTETLPATTPLIVVPARLSIPGGHEIMLAGNARSFGRQDFKDYMLDEHNTYLSRQHIYIWYDDGEYYIEDRSSTNGTRINGIDIKGKGRHLLADGDAIELAGKINIVFTKNIHKEELIHQEKIIHQEESIREEEVINKEEL